MIDLKKFLTPQGAQALRDFATAMPTAVEDIIQSTEKLINIYRSASEDLGAHSDSFGEMLDYIRKAQEKASEAIEVLPKGLEITASKIDAYLSKKPSAQSSATLSEKLLHKNDDVALGGLVATAPYKAKRNNSKNSESKSILAPRSFEDSKEYMSIVDALEEMGVEYRPIELASQERTFEEIVNRLSGGDLTEGSCSSLALAYAGNKAGYDVLDFRDGDSCVFFSTRSSIQQIADLPDVISSVVHGTKDTECVHQLLKKMENGKEYYLATGEHAAIVRQLDDKYEYLELQHPLNGNGWHTLDDYKLYKRFRCNDSRMFSAASFLMDVDSMSKSRELQNILGFINTALFAQVKGAAGYVR